MNNLLPIFMKFEKRSCLIVGGGKIALQKIYQLLDSKALVTVVAPKICKSIQSLSVTVAQRCYQSSDLDGVKLVIAATNDKKVNQGKLSFILLEQIGQAVVHENISEKNIINALETL